MRCRVLCVFPLLCLGSATVLAQDPAPQLALNSGGHYEQARGLVFSTDSRTLISASEDDTIRFWDVASGDCVRTLRFPGGRFFDVALSPDGRLLAAAGSDQSGGRLLIIDIVEYRILRALTGHTLGLASVGFSPDGKTLASGSGDFTARLWEVATGQPLHTLTGHQNNIWSVSFSPDSRQLLTTSQDGVAKVWSVTDGRLQLSLPDHPDSVYGGDWSPDGKWLVTSCDDGYLRFFDAQGRLIRKSQSLQRPSWVDFSASSRNVLVADNGGVGSIHVHLVNATDGKSWRTFKQHTNTVYGVALSPDGRLAASSGGDADEILLWKISDGTLLHRLVGGGQMPFAAAWSPDGRSIAFGYDNLNGEHLIGSKPLDRAFSLQNLTLVDDYRPPARPFRAGDWVVVGNQPAPLRKGNESLGDIPAGYLTPVQSVNGEWLWTYWVNTNDQHLSAAWLQSADVRLAKFGDYQRCQIYRDGAALERVSTRSVGVFRDDRQVATLQMAHRDESVSCYTWLADGTVAVGGSFSITLFDGQSGDVLHEWPTGQISALSPSPDGRYLLSASSRQLLQVWDPFTTQVETSGGIGAQLSLAADGSGALVRQVIGRGPAARAGLRNVDVIEAVAQSGGTFVTLAGKTLPEMLTLLHGTSGTSLRLRVRRLGTQAPIELGVVRDAVASRNDYPLLNLFVARNDWIAWTSEGYYAASPGGEQLMGWQLDHGETEFSEFHSAAKFRKTLYQPDVIRELLPNGGLAPTLAKLGLQATDVTEILPPEVRIVSPANGGTRSAPTVTVRAEATATAGRRVRKMKLLLNGAVFQGPRGERTFAADAGDVVTAEWDVTLAPGAQRLQVLADSEVSQGTSAELELNYLAEEAAARLPTLYVLSIGVAAYQRGDLTLTYADDDARRIADVFQTHARPVFHSVETRVLVDAEATQRGILQGLNWLRTQTTQNDICVLFFSGHGARDADGTFYLLPVDVDPDALLVSGVSETALRQVLAAIPGRRLVMLDACHAGVLGGDTRKGTADLGALMSEFGSDDVGVVTMCSSMGREFSLESGEHKLGYFTLALSEGLAGQADLTGDDNLVYLKELDAYVSERVKTLTRGQQHYVSAFPATIRSFPLSHARP